MNQHYYYWKWDNALPKALIDLALDEVSKSKPIDAEINLLGPAVDAQVRTNQVVFGNPLHWLSCILANYTYNANQVTGWNRKLTLSEGVQIAIYGQSQFYDWHTDSVPMSAEPTGRKLSAVLLLSDSQDFEGGQLEFKDVNEQPVLNQGSLIVFPSILQHRVTPVTRGRRVSAVSWMHGPVEW